MLKSCLHAKCTRSVRNFTAWNLHVSWRYKWCHLKDLKKKKRKKFALLLFSFSSVEFDHLSLVVFKCSLIISLVLTQHTRNELLKKKYSPPLRELQQEQQNKHTKKRKKEKKRKESSNQEWKKATTTTIRKLSRPDISFTKQTLCFLFFFYSCTTPTFHYCVSIRL